MSIVYNMLIHHSPCVDGTVGAWCVRKVFPFIQLFGTTYGKGPPPYDQCRGKNVVLVDFSYKRDEMINLCRVATNVLVLDHHVSAETELRALDTMCPNLKCVFDMSRCGAELAWDYFVGQQRPWFMQVIADYDLWRFSDNRSMAIHKALQNCNGFTFNSLDKLTMANDQAINNLYVRGTQIIEHDNSIITEICNGAENAILHKDGKQVNCMLVTNVPFKYINDVGNRLVSTGTCNLAVVLMNYVSKKQYKASLRSNDMIDCSIIASTFPGGGGHKKAAGFQFDYYLLDTYFTVVK